MLQSPEGQLKLVSIESLNLRPTLLLYKDTLFTFVQTCVIRCVKCSKCVFRVRLQQTVAFLQGDRKVPISALTQPTAENADRCV